MTASRGYDAGSERNMFVHQKEILRLFHISDLHLIEPEREATALMDALQSIRLKNSRSPTFFDYLDHMRRRPCWKGSLGHHSQALNYLIEAWDKACADSSVPTLLMFTGDLSAFGSADQIRLGCAFLSGHRSGYRSKYLVGAGDWRQRATIGNHDFFSCEPRWDPRGLRRLYRGPAGTPGTELCRELNLPYANVHELPESGMRLIVLGANTDREVWGPGARQLKPYSRAFARGAFVTELDELERRLATLDPPRNGVLDVRVLLLHHSPLSEGLGFAICDRSWERLVRFVQDHRIACTFSGHLHVPLGRHLFSDGGDDTVELRCPTTAQDQERLARWVLRSFFEQTRLGHRCRSISVLRRRIAALLSDSINAGGNGFLVHRLFRDEKRMALRWQVDAYTLNNHAFELDDKWKREFPIFAGFEPIIARGPERHQQTVS